MLIAFLHKVMSEEKITIFEYEFFNPVWRVAGVVRSIPVDFGFLIEDGQLYGA